MHKIWEWIKAHKYTSIGIGLGLIFLLYLVSRSGSSSTAATSNNPGGVDDTVAAAEIQANAAVEGANIAAATSANATNAQTQTQLAYINAQEAINTNNNQTQLTANEFDTLSSLYGQSLTDFTQVKSGNYGLANALQGALNTLAGSINTTISPGSGVEISSSPSGFGGGSVLSVLPTSNGNNGVASSVLNPAAASTPINTGGGILANGASI